MAFTQTQVNDWFTANPNATEAQVAETVRGLGGLDANPGLAGMIGQHYGVDAGNVQNAYTAQNNAALQNWVGSNAGANDVQIAQQMQTLGVTPEQAATTMGWNPTETASRYAAATPFATMANQYAAGDYTGLNSLLANNAYTPDQLVNQFSLTQPQLDEIRGKGVNLGYTTPEIQGVVSNILQDDSLSPWKQVNKILETGQSKGVGLDQLQNIYGKETVQPYLDTYKKGINDYLTETLATDPTKTTLNEVGEIHRAAKEFGLTPDEIAKYGGLDPKTAQSYFDMYDRGLGSIVTGLNDPKVDDLTKTKTALSLAAKYGTTDAELAKASNGKYTEKDIAAYLDPVRNVPANLNKLFADENATAKDIQKFIADAKLDPRAAGIYGAALDKFTNNPELYLRDAANGKADISDSYESFLTAAKATPEMATKYAPQIKAIEQAKSIIGKHALNKDFGGEYKDYAMQMFLGLDKNTTKQAPKQLEFGEPTTKKATGFDPSRDSFYEYDAAVPAEPKKGQGVEPVYEYYYGDGESTTTLTGYRQKIDSDEFGKQPVYATYDANGNLTGYESDAKVHVADRVYYAAKWNADGSPAPVQQVKSRGGFGGFMDSFAELGPIGTIALMAATGGLGSLAAGALANTAVGAALGTIGTNAVASGLVSGALSDMSGGDFGKGFVGGAVGSGVGSLAQGAMPNGGLTTTGVPMVDSYLTQAIPKAAGSMASTGVLGGDMGDAGLYSLLNTGVNMGTNSLLQNSGIGTLPTSVQPYATGVASNLVSSALTGKDPNVQNALMKTMMQQAMSTGKSALKTAAKP